MNPDSTQAAPSPPAPLPAGEGRNASGPLPGAASSPACEVARTSQIGPEGKKASNKRRGVVLVAVLIVVASLSLAGYHYSDMMMAESRASEYAHRSVQARAFAESGIHYAAAMLANPDSYNGILGGNPWNNPTAFQAQSVQGDNNLQGYFSIIAPPSLEDTGNLNTNYSGVSDEGAKINVNVVMKLDPKGQQLHDMLMKLPNMTESVANNIVAWMGGQVGIQNGGATDDAYTSLTPPYRCKNGPIDSIDELLLVQGVTRDLLYGADWNRNGMQDANESNINGFDRGWSAYLTVHSREQNSDPTGKPYVFLNNTDLTQLSTDLTAAGLSDNMVKFIIMYRQYGTSSSNSTSVQLVGGMGNLALTFKVSGSTTVQGDLASFPLDLTKASGKSNSFNSLFDLVGAQISIDGPDPNNKKKTITTVYSSPLNDASQLADQLPKLFSGATLVDGPEIPARVNVNTAPMAVLAALPGLNDSDVQNIMSTRPQLSSTDVANPNFNSVAWLLTDAQISVTKLRNLEKYITTRTQVYRVQSIGYFDGKGPAVRLEAVIDTNAGRPRIIAWRDLSELGKGFSENTPVSP
jgi:type II secretory pathway component PulK